MAPVALICAGVYASAGNSARNIVPMTLGFWLGDLWSLAALWDFENLPLPPNIALFVTLFVLGGAAVFAGTALRIHVPSMLAGWAIGLAVMGGGSREREHCPWSWRRPWRGRSLRRLGRGRAGTGPHADLAKNPISRKGDKLQMSFDMKKEWRWDVPFDKERPILLPKDCQLMSPNRTHYGEILELTSDLTPEERDLAQVESGAHLRHYADCAIEDVGNGFSLIRFYEGMTPEKVGLRVSSGDKACIGLTGANTFCQLLARHSLWETANMFRNIGDFRKETH